MPRKYVRKRPAPAYTLEDLNRAVHDVQNKNHTYKEAEQIYRVPKSVIFHRIKGRNIPENKMGAGRPTALPEEVEVIFVNCLKAKARMGYPCNKEDIKAFVAEYLKVNSDLKTLFKNGIPGDDWYYTFMMRHPTLSFKKPELLQKARKDARDPQVIYEFYDELSTLVLENNLLDKPCFVFNTDETGFATDPKRLKAIGEKGKPLVRVSGGSGRESISVLATISADGTFLPPLIVFKGVGVQARWTSPEAYPGTTYTTSSNGWMEEPQFFEWFSTVFVHYVQNIRLQKDLANQAALLMYDGHSSHISFRIIKTALDNNIHLVKFPSHLTDKIQPLDKCVFGPIKVNWEKKLIAFAKTQIEKKDSGRLSKNKFVELLGQVWTESMKPTNIINGFKTAGVFPVDSKQFPESEFDPISLQKYKKMEATKVHSAEDLVVNQENTVGQDSGCDRTNDMPQASQLQPSTSTPVKNQISTLTSKLITPTKIIEIFSTAMHSGKNTPTMATENKAKRKVIPRLKPLKYGEILTTAEVLQKQKEAEDAKLKKSDKKTNQLRKTRKLDTLDVLSTNDDTPATLCQDSSDEDIEQINNSILAQSIPEIEYENPEWIDLKNGTFLLVDFVGGKRNTVHYKYVCSIGEIDEETGDITVLGYRRYDNFATEFILKENDISTISFDTIQAVLPQPRVMEKDRHVVYSFSGSVSVYEK